MGLNLKGLASGIPVIGGMFDDSGDQALEQLKENQRLASLIGLPELKDYRPEEYGYSGDYTPEGAIAEKISEDPELRSQQMAVLKKLSGLADTGLSEVDEQGFNQARKIGARTARAGNAAAMQDARVRGVSGSGLEFAMREMANQDGADRAQDAALAQAAESARSRAMYQTAYGNALSNTRGEDFRAGSANTDIANRFNMENTQNRNLAEQSNLQNRQGVMNLNTGERNDAQKYNNEMRQNQFSNQMQKYGAQTGANTGMAQGNFAQNAARTSERNANTALLAGFAMPGPKKKPKDPMSAEE